LARAEALVVHWATMRATAIERGAADEHVFVVPDALTDTEHTSDADWQHALRLPDEAVTFFATDVTAAHLDPLLSAFAQIVSEVETTVLLLEAAEPGSAELRNKLAAAGISRAVRLVTPQHRHDALCGADVVVTG